MSDALRLLDHPLSSALGWTLVHFVWQGAVLGLVAFFLLRVIRPAQASTRYLIGVATLAAMMMAPVVTFFSGADSPTGSPFNRGTVAGLSDGTAGLVTGSIFTESMGNPAAARQLMPAGGRSLGADAAEIAPVWLPVVTVGWMLGVLALSLRLLGGWVLTLSLARRAVVAVSPAIEAAAGQIAERLALSRGVAVLESAAVTVPTLIGWVRPVVLLPASALSGLTPDQLHAILAHELAHVRRHDYLVNLLQSLVETLLFYHPAVWWVSADVRAERENCCDDLAVAVCGDRLVYVSALAELTSIERRAFALAATDGSLLTRVRRILGRPAATRRELPPTWSLLVLVAIFAGGIGTYEMRTVAAGTPQTPLPAATTAPAPGAPPELPPPSVEQVQAETMAQYLAEQRAIDQAIAEVNRAMQAEAQRTAQAETAREKEMHSALEMRVRALDAQRRALDEARRSQTEDLAHLREVQRAEITRLAAELDRARAQFEPVIAGAFDFEPPLAAAGAASAARAAGFADATRATHSTCAFGPRGPAGATRASNPSGTSRASGAARSTCTPAPPPAPSTRGEGNFSWSNNGERLAVKWTGPFRLSDDERDIAWVEEGARVTISDGWIFTDRIELRGLAGGQVERNFYRSGFRKDYDQEGRPFLVNAIARMIRSGMFASDRVARFLKQGGPDAVLAEIDRIQSDSSHLKRVYYSALLKQADLTPAQLARVLEQVARTVTSNYDKSVLLTQVLQEGPLSDDQRVLVARAAKGISSGYDQRRVLTALLAASPLTPTVAAAVIEGAESISQSYNRSIVLTELARKGGVTAQTSARFMAAVSSMSSAYEQRRVLAALAESSALPEQVALDGVKAAAAITSAHDKRQVLSAYLARKDSSPKVASATLASAATISSSHDKAQVLLEVIEANGVTDESAPAFFAAATSITSSHDLSRVLRALAAKPRLSDAVLTALVRAASSVSSGYERAGVLLETLKAQTLTPALRPLFVQAAEGISSSHDQNRVLAELVRAERR